MTQSWCGRGVDGLTWVMAIQTSRLAPHYKPKKDCGLSQLPKPEGTTPLVMQSALLHYVVTGEPSHSK